MPPSPDWIPLKAATEIISKNSGHRVNQDHVRHMADAGKIGYHEERGKGIKGRGGYRRVYKLSDVEKVIVRKHGGMFAQNEPPKEEVVTES